MMQTSSREIEGREASGTTVAPCERSERGDSAPNWAKLRSSGTESKSAVFVPPLRGLFVFVVYPRVSSLRSFTRGCCYCGAPRLNVVARNSAKS